MRTTANGFRLGQDVPRWLSQRPVEESGRDPRASSALSAIDRCKFIGLRLVRSGFHGSNMNCSPPEAFCRLSRIECSTKSVHWLRSLQACSTSPCVRTIASPSVVVPFTSTWNSLAPFLHSKSYGRILETSFTRKPLSRK